MVQEYVGRRWWFELVELAHKILLTAVVALFWSRTAAQISFAMLVALTYLLTALAGSPFPSTYSMVLVVVGECALYFTFFAGLLLRVRQDSPEDRNAINVDSLAAVGEDSHVL